MIQSVLVFGSDTTAFLAAVTLKARLPELHVIHLRPDASNTRHFVDSSSIDVPKHLHHFLDLDPNRFYEQVTPMWNLGTKFLWGARPYFHATFQPQFATKYPAVAHETGFYCRDDVEIANVSSALMNHDRVFLRLENGFPLVDKQSVAYQLNSEFPIYLEKVARDVGVIDRQEEVTRVNCDDRGITGLNVASGQTLEADLFVDCTGHPARLLSEALKASFHSFAESLPCDRALSAQFPRRINEAIKPYTTVSTMNAGWAWQVHHEHHVDCGYVYSSAFVSDQETEQEFRAKYDTVSDLQRSPLVSGYYEESWKHNVVAIGAASGSVEPLHVSELTRACQDLQSVVEVLATCDRQPQQTAISAYNRRMARRWESMRNLLSMLYKFNSRNATPFWKQCWNGSDLGESDELVDFYRENGPNVQFGNAWFRDSPEINLDHLYTVLLGQNVPFEGPIAVTAEEMQVWRNLQSQRRRAAIRAFTVKEALETTRSPNWIWNQDNYRNWR
jgi:tryptophan halogenase